MYSSGLGFREPLRFRIPHSLGFRGLDSRDANDAGRGRGQLLAPTYRAEQHTTQTQGQ